ncbi:putative disease resistance protein RGA3 [Magnolia sinica]|uniref:putative disease resistance protein RGA3 n=1 Tax=Magnolia sinica TaxID=86752 RepID=UPI00265B604C|nr:putative disease resistance protein RGA3 [Magnolia sinica]
MDIESGIPPTLWLSYCHLPAHLKRCFAYCSVFLKDCKIEKDKLIKLWMAQNLIRPNRRRAVEDVGKDYFNHLVGCSLFESIEDDDVGVITFKMHDLVHDLAYFVAKGECGSLEIGKPGRHLSLILDDVVSYDLTPLFSVKKLCTLLLSAPAEVEAILDSLFHRLLHLRTLDLSGSFPQILSSSIGELSIRILEKVASVDEAREAELERTSHLRSFSLHWDVGPKPVFDGILTSCEMKMPKLGFEELGRLDAIFEGLRLPQMNLKELEIIYYPGSRFPSWIGNLFFAGLIRVTLSHCENCSQLPALAHLPSLRYLYISESDEKRELTVENDNKENVAMPSLINDYHAVPQVEEVAPPASSKPKDKVTQLSCHLPSLKDLVVDGQILSWPLPDLFGLKFLTVLNLPV